MGICSSRERLRDHDGYNDYNDDTAALPPARATAASGSDGGSGGGGGGGGSGARSSSRTLGAGTIASQRENTTSDPSTSTATTAKMSDGRLNQPLRGTLPIAASPARLTHRPWTRMELQQQRQSFFETRVTGAAEAWAALGVICEMLRQGDVAGAQGILDASGLSCPSGYVAIGDARRSRSGVLRVGKGGVYDAKGVLYEIPGWVVADPADVVDEGIMGDEDDEEEDGDEGDMVVEKDAAAFLEADDGNGDEKAKAIAKGKEMSQEEQGVGEMVKVKARLSNSCADVVVKVGMEEKIGTLVHKIAAKAGVGADKIKLVHLGKMMRENERLSQTGWIQGHVVNAMVFD